MKRKKRFSHRREKENLPRVNKQIRARQVRLVIEGEGVKIVSLQEALQIAEERGLDLVEVSPNQDPPVCKILDFGKWKFEQQKKKKQQQKNQHTVDLKELKFTPQIGEHDYQIKLDKAIKFLQKGDKLRITLRFRGRQLAHPELGMQLVHRLIQDTEEFGTVEVQPKLDGRQIITVIAPKTKKSSK